MKLNYVLKCGVVLLDGARIELTPGRPCLIVGENTPAYHVLGGIIAGLIPITDGVVPWAPIEELLRPYTGKLDVVEGALPESTAYVGPDPDQMLLFSRVEDNFRSLGMDRNQAISALTRFGLAPSFLRRTLSALSGGERMRVALSLAFSSDRSCYALHGVVPWLDSSGRAALLAAIRSARSSHIVLLEHEREDLLCVTDAAYLLDGGQLRPMDFLEDIHRPERRRDQIPTGVRPEGTAPLVQFKEVSFLDYPGSEIVRQEPLLDALSFAIYPGQNYCIVGPNGSGKSSIAKLVYKLLTPDKGMVELNGTPLASLTREDILSCVTYLSQYPLQQLPLPTVGSYKKHCHDNAIALQLIDSWVPVPDHRCVIQLTPLQQKLLVLASAITPTTRVVVLDEPTWGLSAKDEAEFLTALSSMCGDSRSILVISHNTHLADSLRAELLYLTDGHISRERPPHQEAVHGADAGRETHARAMLWSAPLSLKLLGLVAVATFCYGFVFVVSESTLVVYCVALSLVASLLVVLLRAAVQRSAFHILMVTWAFGSLLYVAVAALVVMSGASLSPYMSLDTPTTRWLYTLSHPLRMLATITSGMLFFQFTSPLEFGLFGRWRRRATLLFRSAEFATEALLDTMQAMVMLSRWPDFEAANMVPRQAWVALRRSPELLGTVIRNILVWSPWAWMCMSRTVAQHKALKSGGKR
ncbi:MAG: ATP-binding cassette domain-containing protein [Planctomycetota bacterium]